MAKRFSRASDLLTARLIAAAQAAVDEEFVRKGEEDRRLSDRGVIDTFLGLVAAQALATAPEVDDAGIAMMTDCRDAMILGIGSIEIAATAKGRGEVTNV